MSKHNGGEMGKARSPDMRNGSLRDCASSPENRKKSLVSM